MPLTLWGNPILDRPAAPLTDADFGAGLAELGERMLKVRHAARGVGLAAPQVGLDMRFFVYECDGRRGLLANPRVVDRSRELSDDDEGCLSIPGFAWPTPRAAGQLYLSRLGGRLGKLARREAKQASWYGEPHRFVPIS